MGIFRQVLSTRVKPGDDIQSRHHCLNIESARSNQCCSSLLPISAAF
jgi:hypothetical protein